MKILITGSGSSLARDLAPALKNEGFAPLGLNKEQLNILNEEKLDKAVDEHKPVIIVNCAAYTKLDMAEIEREKAFRVNALGARNLAEVCRRKGMLLVHFSTEHVFPGARKDLCHTFAVPDPLNYYGTSKAYGEQYIRESGCEYLIVRTSWLYGQHGNNFVLKVLRACDDRESVEAVSDQFGSPTFVHTVSRYLVKLLKNGARGVFHVTDKAGNGISWFTFARKIVEVFGRTAEVVPVTSASLTRPAKRPVYSSLDVEATEFFLGEKLPYWETSLGEFRKRMKV